MRSKIIVPLLLGGAVAALTLGCGGSSSTSSARAPGSAEQGRTRLDISKFKYAPADITVKAGTAIIVSNLESVEHTATSDTEGEFDTGPLKDGGRATVTLTKPGSYSYHCAFHAFMRGTIKVVN